ncbi:MAG TPA: serine/threonine-protein kinase [Candidatus Binataceae bacterium]|jgi:serine/threonine protein kinase
MPPDETARLCMGCMNDRGAAAICPTCGYDEIGPPSVPFQLAPRSLLNDQYLVGRALGAGGFAITYLGWDIRLARRIAIKEYMPSGMASRSVDTSEVVPHGGPTKDDFYYGLEHFLDEARMVAQFEGHPGIIAVTNFFPAHGTAYLVMEYLEGTTLKDYLTDHGGRLAFNEALDIMTPAMDALREVHRVNVLHRDISPDNIYVTSAGQVKLLDFGAARQALRDRSQRLSVILKVGYAPEEQYRSTGNQGPWTDVYAVGATFYHLLTGSIPPPSIDRLAEDTIQLPSAVGSDIPPAAEQALMTALSVKAAHRYPTIQDFQAAIGVAQTGLPAPPQPHPTPGPDPQGLVRTLPPWAMPAAGAGVIVLAILGGFLIFHRTPGQPYTYGQPNAQPSVAAAQPSAAAAQPSLAAAQPSAAAAQPSVAAAQPTAQPSNPLANSNPYNPYAAPGPAGVPGLVDSRLIGTWVATVPTPNGPLHVRFSPNNAGTYRTALRLGASRMPDDIGAIQAVNGLWSRLGQNGVPDHGTYTFNGPDQVIFTTTFGAPVVYHRE